MSRMIKNGAVSRRNCPVLRSHKKQTGATLVEYAFSILIFMMLIFGVTGFSHMLYAYHFVNHIAKEATHWAAVNGKYCFDDASCGAPASSLTVDAYVKNHAPLGLDRSKIATFACGVEGGTTDCAADSTPTVCGATPNYAGCTVQVKVAYAYNFIFPLLPANTTVTAPCTQAGYCLSSTSEMIISH